MGRADMAGNVADLPDGRNTAALTGRDAGPDAVGPQDAALDPGGLPAMAASLRQASQGQGSRLCLAAAQLASRHLRYDAADPLWPDRDRVAVDTALPRLAQALETLSGTPGLCATPGPAVGAGAGLALAERMLAARFGRSLVDHRAWVLCSGHALATGPVQEAAWLAGAWRLGRLSVLAEAEDDAPAGLAGFAANGWAVRHACADDPVEVAACLSAALRSQKPTLVICGGPIPPDVPEVTLRHGPDLWAACGSRLAGVRRGWLKRLARHASRQDFEAACAGRLPPRWYAPLSEPPAPAQPAAATAHTARAAAVSLHATLPELAILPGDPAWPQPPGQSEPPAAAHAAGSRPRTGHSATSRLVAGHGAGSPLAAGHAAGSRLAAGLGGVLLGAALHGGVVPLAAPPAEDADAVLPALRAAAQAGIRLLQMLVEPAATDLPAAAAAAARRAGLRATPNLFVFRPADATETLECLELAIRRTTGPSVLLLAASPRPALAERPARTRSARGGYVAAEATGQRAVTLVASGPELEATLQARALLARDGIAAAVVSLPCWNLFALQDAAWCAQVLGRAPRIAIEPGGGFGWERWLGPDGLVLPNAAEAQAAAWTSPGDDAQAMADMVADHLCSQTVWTGAPLT